MKKNLFLSGLVVLSLLSACAVADNSLETANPSDSALKPAYDTTGYGLIWQDEFDKGYVDTAKWNFDIGNGNWGWGNGELEYYRAENATVSGGMLNITAKRESYGGFNFTSARLNTAGKFSFMYGKIVARIKMPAGSGLWAAFWMLGNNGGTWPRNGEIDIMENLGNNTVLSTCHWWADSQSVHAEYGKSTSTSATSAFHDYEVEWDSSMIRARVDGVEYYAISISPAELSELRQNFYIILNLALGGTLTGNVTPTALPAVMQVDYVRVYQKGAATPTPTPTPTPTSNPGTPSVTIVSGSLYEVVSVASGKAMDVSGASANAGAVVQQWTRNNSQAQIWKITDMGNGLKFTAQCSGKALDCSNWGTANGTKLIQWDDHGGVCQRFGAGLYGSAWKFYTVQSGNRCIDVPSASKNDGVQLQLWDDNSSSAQRWYLYKK